MPGDGGGQKSPQKCWQRPWLEPQLCHTHRAQGTDRGQVLALPQPRVGTLVSPKALPPSCFGEQEQHGRDVPGAPGRREFSSSRIQGRITTSFIIFKDTRSWRENEFFFITQFPGYFYCAS